MFLLHPELAPSVIEALQRSDDEVAETIVILTLATLYLQQWWIFRFIFALGRLPSFPEAPFVSLWEERGFPSPHSGYGLDGLLALQASIEFASPDDFLPLPTHWEARSEFIKRYGQVDAFYFD